MAYTYWLSDKLREQTRTKPVEVRMALDRAIAQTLDHGPPTPSQWGQLELPLRDENADSATTYIEVDRDWIPGYVGYRWEERGIRIRHIKWPSKGLVI